MSRMHRLAVSVVAVAVLAGCASTQQPVARAPAAQMDQANSTVDRDYMAAVQYVADKRGVNVRWVNPPTKRGPQKN